LKHRLKTDRHGVNVWPYASRMLDESRIKDVFQNCANAEIAAISVKS